MLKHNTSTSRELLEHISDDENVLDYIPEKELFNKANTQHISVFDIAKNDEKTEQMNKVFYQKIEQVFSNITNIYIYIYLLNKLLNDVILEKWTAV